MSAQVLSQTIRPALPKDYPVIQAIAEVTWKDTFYPEMLTMAEVTLELARDYSLEALTRQVAAGHHYVLLLDAADTAIAYAAYSIDAEAIPKTLTLHKLYCMPKAQGQGAGKALMDFVETEARNDRCHQLDLLVNRQNRAVQFYTSRGFSIVESLETVYGPVVRKDYRMVKVLDNLIGASARAT